MPLVRYCKQTREVEEMREETVLKMGRWASIACSIHCLVVPFVIPIIPALGIVSHNEWFEGVFWLLSCSVACWHGWRTRGIVRYSFWLVAAVGTIGFLTHNHELLHFGFFGVAAGTLLRKKPVHVCGRGH